MAKKAIFATAAALMATCFLAVSPAGAAESPQAAALDWWPLLAAGLAWLIPVGLTLIAAAAVPAARAWHVALAGVAAAALAVVAFFAVGFGLAFGGVGLVSDPLPGLGGLVWEWTFLSADWGPDWGMVGLSGWALRDAAATPAAYSLFVAQLPWVTTATLLPLLALRGRAPAGVSLVGGLLVGGLLYPIATNWIWGGGWLANLGQTLNLGHGVVDFAGAGTAFLVGGAVALAGLLVLVPRRPRRERDEPVELPPAHMPLLAGAGALLLLAGSVGWAWANPLLDPATLIPTRGAVNTLLAAAAATLVPLGYAWFVAGRPDSLMTAKGFAAGFVAAVAVGPFVPPWAALAMGAAAGLLVPFLTYLVEELLRLADDTAVVAVFLAGAVVGLTALGLVADGLAGQGWNGIGGAQYLGVAGQGVTGWLAAAGMEPDWPGQMQAQLVGVAALSLPPLVAGFLLFGILAAFHRGVRRMVASRTPRSERPAPVTAETADPAQAPAELS